MPINEEPLQALFNRFWGIQRRLYSAAFVDLQRCASVVWLTVEVHSLQKGCPTRVVPTDDQVDSPQRLDGHPVKDAEVFRGE